VLQRARALAAEGFAAEPAGLCHGFLVERWRDDLAPLRTLSSCGASRRERFLGGVADYLAFRALAFPAVGDSGATPAALLEMARQNSVEALGDDAAAAWERWRPSLAQLAARVRRVATDNRMHAWEWRVGAARPLKTDALDHHAGHDLVGCQDIAWDVVGAAVELELSAAEEAGLAAAVGRRTGRTAEPSLRAFYRACYLAFQVGYWTEARNGAAADEAVRIGRLVERRLQGLRSALRERARGGPAGSAVTA
jgi:hypothetical protein